MISGNVIQADTPSNQFISFVEGSASTAPNPSSYPLHVLGADHNLNHIQGGDPTDGFSPWVTDILVYPSSEYWEGLLSGTRVRPYVDLSISDYNTLRIPSAVHNYDLYVDSGRFYENVIIDGTLTVGTTTLGGTDLGVSGDLDVVGSIEAASIDITGDITGTANTKTPILQVTADVTFNNSHTGYIYQCKPTGANVAITLPATSTTGVAFSVMNCLSGKTVTFSNLTNARGTTLGAQYSSATVYWDGGAWYAFGDLV